MRQRYKVNQLMISLLPDPDAPGPVCRAPSLPDCAEQTLCAGVSMIECGTTVCQVLSRCVDVTFLDCGVSNMAEVECKGCSLVLSCGLTRISHPAVCSAAHLEGLSVLRAQLTAALAQVDEREGLLEEATRPQSTDEIDALEGRLKAALETVAEWRAEQERKEG